MNPVFLPYADVEAAYRRERLTSAYRKTRQHDHLHHPGRVLGRAISHAYHRMEGV
jgi:hypothetical protein